MKVAVGQMWFEAETFSPVKTTLADFQSTGIYLGQEMLDKAEATGEVGGFIAAAKVQPQQVDFIPTVRGSCVPGGPAETAAFEYFKENMLTPIKEAKKLDGVLLALHGAMVAEGLDDCEGALLAEIRELVGPRMPIAISLDLHANITQAMIDNADVIRGYHECPHVDMFETGHKAASVLFAMARNEVKPVCAWRKIPMLMQLAVTIEEGAYARIYEMVKQIESQPGVLCASFFSVTPYLDVDEMGSSVIVYTDNDKDLAEKLADQLAKAAWDFRHDLQYEPPTLREAIEWAFKAPEGPVIISDAADNILAGTTGDATAALEILLDIDAQGKAFLPMLDPEAVAEAVKAGLGQEVELEVGGKMDKVFSKPVRVKARVKAIEDGKMVVEGAVLQGTVYDMGRIVVLEAGNVNILLTEGRYPGHDPALFRAGGLKPEEAQIVVVKSVNHAKTNFAGIYKDYIVADAPGLSTLNTHNIPYRKIPRPMFPLDEKAEFVS